MQYLNLEDINERCRRDPADFILTSEQQYTDLIERVAEQVCASRHQILLLNGPSSSGKTTTAHRIRDAVQRRGIRTHSISMDDYYLSRNTFPVPKDEFGADDLESPLCMDLPLLSEHLAALCQGKTIEVPKYDFMTHRRTEQREEIRLRRGEIAVIEGIHSFNDVVTGKIQEHATGVYISVKTAVVLSQNQLLAPHELRFVRRAIRDRKFRDSPVLDTIRMWYSVRRGERLYIQPYLSTAAHRLNTYLPYEDCILMHLLRREVEPYHRELTDAGLEPLVRALDRFARLDEVSHIPPQSIMREFIG